MLAAGSEQGTQIAKSVSGPFSKANKWGGRVGIKLMRCRAVSANSPGERFVLFPGAGYCPGTGCSWWQKTHGWKPEGSLGAREKPWRLQLSTPIGLHLSKKNPSIFSWLIWKIKMDHPYLTGCSQCSWERVQDKAEQDLQFTVWCQK